MAGKRKGKEDDRYLWPECIRLVREIQPEWCVFENVPGLVNWNGGMVFNEVQADLEAAGYEVIPFLLPACGVNAPHKRERVWFVARKSTASNSDLHGYELRGFGKNRCEKVESENEGNQREWIQGNVRGEGEQGITPNSQSQQSEWVQSEQREFSQSKQGEFRGNYCSMGSGDVADAKSQGYKRTITEGTTSEGRRFMQSVGFDRFPTVSPICQRNDEFSNRLSGITFPKWRNESIKALGNAIVPAVVFQIFKAIESYNFEF